MPPTALNHARQIPDGSPTRTDPPPSSLTGGPSRPHDTPKRGRDQTTRRHRRIPPWIPYGGAKWRSVGIPTDLLHHTGIQPLRNCPSFTRQRRQGRTPTFGPPWVPFSSSSSSSIGGPSRPHDTLKRGRDQTTHHHRRAAPWIPDGGASLSPQYRPLQPGGPSRHTTRSSVAGTKQRAAIGELPWVPDGGGSLSPQHSPPQPEDHPDHTTRPSVAGTIQRAAIGELPRIPDGGARLS
jgi:hypothetical protein